MGLLSRLLRFRYVAVVAAFLVFALASAKDDGDLHYFSDALTILGHGGHQGNIHLYAVAPDTQIGPLAILGIGLLDLLCAGKIIFAVTLGALGLLLLMVRLLEGLARDEGHDGPRVQAALMVGGVALAGAWVVVVPGWGHLDDLAALTALVAALRSARAGRAGWAGALLAVAVGCKPWGAFALAVLLFLPPGRRLRGLTVFGAVVVCCWAPFLLGAPASLSALAHFSLPTSAGTLPRQLGYARGPDWVRPAQLVLTLASVTWCWRRGRADLVLLCVAVSRLVLDAGLFPYYDVELVLGALVADVLAAGTRWPRALAPLTVVSWAAVSAIRAAHLDSAATLTARDGLYAALLLAAALGGRRRSRPTPAAEVTAATEVTSRSAVAAPVRTPA